MEMKRVMPTVLAALRHWQLDLPIMEDTDSPSYRIATDGGTIQALSPDEIDELCEELNTDGWLLLSPEMADAIGRHTIEAAAEEVVNA